MPVATLPDGTFPADLATALTVGDSGIVLAGGPGQMDPFGVLWKNTSGNVRGDGASPREVTGDNESRHGQWDATKWYSNQLIQVTGTARATSHAALHDAEMRLRRAVNIRTIDYLVTEPYLAGVFSGRRQGGLLWTEDSQSSGYAHATFSFTIYSKGSFIVSAAPQSFTLDYPSSSSVVDWSDPGVDWSDPGVDWSGSDVGGVLSVTNPGTEPVGLLLQFTAPAQNARFAVQNDTSTQALYLYNGDDYGVSPMLTTGQILTVDTRNGLHKVTLNGDSRRYWAYGDFPVLPVGTSTIYLSGSATGGQCLIAFAPLFS